MRISMVALGAMLTLGLAGPASAADLGKNDGIADLEERVATLEKDVVRKDRRLSVVISGEINVGYLFTDNLGSNQHGVITNSTTPTRIGLDGSAKFGEKGEWRVGYKVEIGFDPNPPIPLLDNELTVRQSYLYISGPVGTVSLGHQSLSTDKIVEITVANTAVASRMMSLAPLSTVYFLGFDSPLVDLRRSAARYDSPTFAGFMLSASYANGDSAFSSLINSGFNSQHVVDFAVRWSGETSNAGGWRAAAGVGYRDESFALNASPISFLPYTRDRVFSGSASIMNMATGLFANVAAAHVKGETLFGGDWDAYQIQAGWEGKLTKLGTTTVFGEWGQLRPDGTSTRPTFWGGGIVQNIAPGSLDLYFAYKRIDTDLGAPEVSSAMVGARVRF